MNRGLSVEERKGASRRKDKRRRKEEFKKMN